MKNVLGRSRIKNQSGRELGDCLCWHCLFFFFFFFASMEASHYGRIVVSSSSCTSIMIRAGGSGKVGVQEEAIRTRLPRSTRALPMRVITVGKTRSIGVQNITLEYTKKIQHYCRFEDVQVRSNPKNTRHGLPPTITTTAATIFPILDAVLFC